MKANKLRLVRFLAVLVFVCALALTGCDKLPLDFLPHEHSVIEHDGAEPTCTEDGWTPYETCSKCEEYTTYKTIPATGHDYTEKYQPDGEVHSIICKRCAHVSESADHEWQKSASTEPTCQEAGTANFVCSVCMMGKTAPIEALGHDYNGESVSNGDTHLTFCTRCDSKIGKPHNWYEKESSTATCESDGIIKYACADCDAERSEIANALGHEFSDTYQPNGDELHSIFCIRCDCSKEDTEHVWQEGEVLVESTCMTAGMQIHVCLDCGFEKIVGLKHLGHDYKDEFVPNGDVHTQICTRCGTTKDSDHVWQDGGVIKAPECGIAGMQGYVCTLCGAEKTEDIEPLEHIAGEWEVANEPTAFTEGDEVLKCILCSTVLESKKIPADVESMPRIYFVGEYWNAGNSKNEVDMTVSYVNPNGDSFESYATIKVQGSSSVAYDKKNYTVKFFKDEAHDDKNKVDIGWGKQNKYVLKANWVDFSQARNVVSCHLWGDLVKSRPATDTQQRLAALKTNGGAIDGFPIAVYMNGEFYGLYTMNVPKDEWMFGMGVKDENGKKSQTEALIGSDDWNHTDFYSTIGSFVEEENGDIVAENGGWELIYYGGDDHAWVAASFDALITFCQQNEGAAFKVGISQYLDVDAAIDYLIYMYANCMHDNASKNMLWATYDGKVWIPSAYDQDGTFGQYWDGIRFESAGACLPIVKNGKIDVNINYGPSGDNDPKFILWDRMWNAFTDEILARYTALRATTLSTENIIAELMAFEDAIPESMFEADLEVWRESRENWWSVMKKQSGTWDYTKYHYDYMYQWVTERMAYYDAAIQSIQNFVNS